MVKLLKCFSNLCSKFSRMSGLKPEAYLVLMVTGVRVISYHDVQPTTRTGVLVATRTPVLPLTLLRAGALHPLLFVVQTDRGGAVALQRKVSLGV